MAWLNVLEKGGHTSKELFAQLLYKWNNSDKSFHLSHPPPRRRVKPAGSLPVRTPPLTYRTPLSSIGALRLPFASALFSSGWCSQGWGWGRRPPRGSGRWGKGEGRQGAHVPRPVLIPTRGKERRDGPSLGFALPASSAGRLLASGCPQHSQGWEEAQMLQMQTEVQLQTSFLRSSPSAAAGRCLQTGIILSHTGSPSQSPLLIPRKNRVIPGEGRAGRGVLWAGGQGMPFSLSTEQSWSRSSQASEALGVLHATSSGIGTFPAMPLHGSDGPWGFRPLTPRQGPTAPQQTAFPMRYSWERPLSVTLLKDDLHTIQFTS